MSSSSNRSGDKISQYRNSQENFRTIYTSIEKNLQTECSPTSANGFPIPVTPSPRSCNTQDFVRGQRSSSITNSVKKETRRSTSRAEDKYVIDISKHRLGEEEYRSAPSFTTSLHDTKDSIEAHVIPENSPRSTKITVVLGECTDKEEHKPHTILPQQITPERHSRGAETFQIVDSPENDSFSRPFCSFSFQDAAGKVAGIFGSSKASRRPDCRDGIFGKPCASDPRLLAAVYECQTLRCSDINIGNMIHINKQKIMEHDIGSLLGNKGCNAWHSWVLRCDNGEEHSTDLFEAAHARREIRNRAGDLISKSTRMGKLRANMGANSTQIHLKQTQSFDVNALRPRGPSTSKKLESNTLHDISPMNNWLGPIVSCGDTNKTIRENVSRVSLTDCIEDDESLCYDSDPEEVKFRKHTKNVRSDAGMYTKSLEKNERSCVEHRRQKLDSATLAKPVALQNSSSFDFVFANEEKSSRLVAEILNIQSNFIWHPSSSRVQKDVSPTYVSAWFERGARLRQTLVHPRFVFNPTNNSRNNNTKNNISNRYLKGAQLLDICKVLEVNQVDRSLYPFAKPRRSFIVGTDEESFLLEASSEEERNMFVRNIKFLVARLGSKIIVGNCSVFDEFFSNETDGVPGKAPIGD